MSERQKQTEFFKAVIQSDRQGENLKLCDRIAQAERDECCVRRAMFLAFLLASVSFLGCGYTFVVKPEVILESGHGLKKLFMVLSVGSLIAFTVYLGCWFYYRALLQQVHNECRKFIMKNVVRNSGKHGWEPLKSYQIQTS